MKALVYLGEQEMVIREEPAQTSANEVIILISAAAIAAPNLRRQHMTRVGRCH